MSHLREHVIAVIVENKIPGQACEQNGSDELLLSVQKMPCTKHLSAKNQKSGYKHKIQNRKSTKRISLRSLFLWELLWPWSFIYLFIFSYYFFYSFGVGWGVILSFIVIRRWEISHKKTRKSGWELDNTSINSFHIIHVFKLHRKCFYSSFSRYQRTSNVAIAIVSSPFSLETKCLNNRERLRLLCSEFFFI